MWEGRGNERLDRTAHRMVGSNKEHTSINYRTKMSVYWLELSDPGKISVVGFLNPSNYNLGSKNGEDFLILETIPACNTVL
jgi:hypothetical protein